MPEPIRCETCQYFVESKNPKEGKCHRMPPTVMLLGVRDAQIEVKTMRPIVQPLSDWCGEHKKK